MNDEGIRKKITATLAKMSGDQLRQIGDFIEDLLATEKATENRTWHIRDFPTIVTG